MPLDEDSIGGRRTTEKRRNVSRCPRVSPCAERLTIRPGERPLRIKMENIPLTELNLGAYRGMKSSPTPTESAKAETQDEW